MSTPASTADTLHHAAQTLLEETIAQRRDFHRHPEIAFEEVRTSGIIADNLEALGLEVRRNVGTTGVVAVLDTGKPGRTVLARADIDALPIQDEKSTPYRSQVAGKMHACGHDGHAAVLLSVAKLLAERRESLTGRVVFVFQPAEEIVGGAKAMLEDGALKGLAPDAVIGLHLISDYPTGTIALRSGPAMAATGSFRMRIKGFGGHAAKPHECVDPVLIAAQLITALQSLVARETDPQDSAVVSVTSLHAGTAYNIIPEEVELKGTLRTFLPETRERLAKRIETLSRGLVTSLRGELELVWITDSPAVVNDPAMTERMRRVAATVVGEERVVESTPTMGGDDMALWLQQAPGCYFFVGAGNEALGADKPHHHPRFDLDEAALGVAIEALAKGVLEYLTAA
jgi:amidohydrolase